MGTNGHDADEHVLFSLLQDHGFAERSAWIRLGEGGHGERRLGEKPKSKQAGAKAKQRREDRKNGWAECYAKAPDDDDARRLIADVGKAIKDPRTRRAIRIALRNPCAVLLCERVLHTKGIKSRIARVVLAGCLGRAPKSGVGRE
jgi:hypothetical protein